MNPLHEIAYRVDPVLWVRDVLGVTPMPWQETYLRAPLGASLLALTARQVGKTTTAAWAIAHTMLFRPGSLSVIACPAQRQSAEAVRRVREAVLKAGCKLKGDNVYAIELENGSRVLALPGSDDSIRGLTVDGWIVADEAARLSHDLIAALRPMRARCPQARLAMLSTAWSRTDPFWTAWASEDPTWNRLKATADTEGCPFTAEFLEQERLALGEEAFKREFLGIPTGGQASPFTWELYEWATTGALGGETGTPFRPLDPATWPYLNPPIIAHDVGRSRDRSTALVGGTGPAGSLLGMLEFHELPQNLYGNMRAREVARVDQRYGSRALIVADLSSDESYAEALFDAFGPRVIGLHITRSGDGMEPKHRPVRNHAMLVYTIGRTLLLEFLHSQLVSRQVRIVDGPMSQKAYAQLMALEQELRETGTVYTCPPGQHDDLAISAAMLAWAARHPHLPHWHRMAMAGRRPRPRGRVLTSAAGWT